VTDVQALFVDTGAKGVYPTLLGAERCWGKDRDARKYVGTDPVVTHPPCNLWVNFAAVNWKRYGRERPAWYPGGTDHGCFEFALSTLWQNGGVLEHPARSHAWAHYGLTAPPAEGGWLHIGTSCLSICEVWQGAYGHRACSGKPTWLIYAGARPPFELNWARTKGTIRMSGFDKRPDQKEMCKRERSATPRAFAETLIRLAAWSVGE
jgi:hypothetical protein